MKKEKKGKIEKESVVVPIKGCRGKFMKKYDQLTNKDHDNMDGFFGHLLDDYKEGRIDKTRAVATLSHIVAAIDKGNYSEAQSWFEQGRKWLEQEAQAQEKKK